MDIAEPRRVLTWEDQRPGPAEPDDATGTTERDLSAVPVVSFYRKGSFCRHRHHYRRRHVMEQGTNVMCQQCIKIEQGNRDLSNVH